MFSVVVTVKLTVGRLRVGSEALINLPPTTIDRKFGKLEPATGEEERRGTRASK